jgi:hypothetical protein
MTKNIELWADFETWLERNYKSNVSDLSWNSYVERSKEYNSQRLNRNVDFDTTKIRHGLGRE